MTATGLSALNGRENWKRAERIDSTYPAFAARIGEPASALVKAMAGTDFVCPATHPAVARPPVETAVTACLPAEAMVFDVIAAGVEGDQFVGKQISHSRGSLG